MKQKSTFDIKPDLVVEEGNVIRINYEVEEVEEIFDSMHGDEESTTRTVYKAYVTRLERPATYERIVSAIVNDGYSTDEMQAVVNNYQQDPTKEECAAAYNEMQAWRRKAKEVARAVMYGDTDTNLEYVKEKVLDKISDYDSSSAVNSFVLNGTSVWLDKATRVGLMNSTSIAKAMGSETTTLWLGEVKLEVECNKAIQLLSALEMYALECFNVTAAHKKAVSEMTEIDKVLEYDYTTGYPSKLTMDI